MDERSRKNPTKRWNFLSFKKVNLIVGFSFLSDLLLYVFLATVFDWLVAHLGSKVMENHASSNALSKLC